MFKLSLNLKSGRLSTKPIRMPTGVLSANFFKWRSLQTSVPDTISGGLRILWNLPRIFVDTFLRRARGCWLLAGPGLVSGSRFRDNNKGADRSTLNDSQKCGLKNKYFFSVENIFVVCTAAFHGPVIFIYSWVRDQTTRRNVRSPLSDSVNIWLGRVDREACIWMELKYPLILCQ